MTVGSAFLGVMISPAMFIFTEILIPDVDDFLQSSPHFPSENTWLHAYLHATNT